MIQIARDLGYTVVERDIARAELYLAEEVFLTGTAAELVPVREIDDHLIGEPGEITRVVQAKFEDALHGRAEEYLEWLDFVEVRRSVTDRVRSAPDAPSFRGNRANYRSRLAAGAACRAGGPARALSPISRIERHQMEQVKLYDTTLRDGMQGEGMSLSAREKMRVVQALDGLGVQMIEAGFPSSNPKEEELFEPLAELELEQATICAFGMTRRARRRGRRRPGAGTLVDSFAPVVDPGRQDLGAPPGEGDQGLRARRTWR